MLILQSKLRFKLNFHTLKLTFLIISSWEVLCWLTILFVFQMCSLISLQDKINGLDYNFMRKSDTEIHSNEEIKDFVTSGISKNDWLKKEKKLMQFLLLIFFCLHTQLFFGRKKRVSLRLLYFHINFLACNLYCHFLSYDTCSQRNRLDFGVSPKSILFS